MIEPEYVTFEGMFDRMKELLSGVWDGNTSEPSKTFNFIWKGQKGCFEQTETSCTLHVLDMEIIFKQAILFDGPSGWVKEPTLYLFNEGWDNVCCKINLTEYQDENTTS